MRFTKKEDKIIMANYKKMPLKRLSRQMGRSEGSVRQRLHRLGYKVPKKIVEKWKKESQFKQGQEAFNKGMRLKDYMGTESIHKIKKTQFKKGNLPVNTKYNGCITIRYDKNKKPYYHIRIRKAKWEYLHRYLWQQNRGPIPDVKVVAFKDGNQMNCKISNLKLISMRRNMLRNSVQRFPDEIRLAILKIGVLNRKINKYEKHTQ